MSRSDRGKGKHAPERAAFDPGTSWLWKTGLGLYAARLALIPIVFDQGALDAFAHPKALLARSISCLLAAVLVAVFAIHGRKAFSWSPLHATVLGYGVITVLATVFAVDKVVAVFGSPDRMLGLLGVLDLLVVYAATATFLRRRSGMALVLAAIAVPAAIALAYALLQWAGLDPIAWAGDPVGRTFSTLGNPTLLSLYLGTIGLVSAAAAILAPVDRAWRAVLAGVSLALIVGAASTAGKALLLGLGAAIPALAIVLWLHGPSRRFRIRSIAALGVTAIIGILVLAVTPLGARVAAITDPSAIVDPARLVLYEVALKQIRSRPLLGVGPDNYVVAFPEHRPELGTQLLGAAVPETSPHSWIAKVGTDTGMAGLGAFLLIIGLAGALALRGRNWAELVAFIGIVGFLAQGLVSVNAVATEWMLWLALGVIAAVHGRRPDVDQGQKLLPKRTRRHAKVSGTRRVVAGIALALGAILALSALPEWQASRDAETARRARATNDTATAIAAASSAVSRDPRRAEYWHGLGLAQVSDGEMRLALDSFEKAVDRSPYHASYIGSLARAQLALGLSGDAPMKERARETALEGVRQDPNNGEVHYTVALVSLGLGDPVTAALESERGWELNPNSRNRSVYDVAVQAYLARGDAVGAERWLRRGIQWVGPAVDLRLRLVRLLIDQDRSVEAKTEVEQILLLEPDHAGAKQLEAELEARR